MNPVNPIQALRELGQSIWYDNIQRSLIASGELNRMVEEDGLAGMTSNPTIFEKAIDGSPDYDADLRDLIGRGAPVETMLDELTARDIRAACDVFRPLFRHTRGMDGRVSIEVAPAFGMDTAGTIREARRLAALVGRPNLMVKVPATLPGLAAIEALTAQGVSVNVTLIFSVERYEAVMSAYLAGLETRAAEGLPLSDVRSVASFFVSRIDVAANKELDRRLRQDLGLTWKIGIANSKRAYGRFRKVFGGGRFRALERKGANLQRVLWASTGTKDPSLPAVYYVEALAGPDSINTLPPDTYRAFRVAGKAAPAIERDVDEAERQLAALEHAGVSLPKICAGLETSGLASFAESWNTLSATLSSKSKHLVHGKGASS